MGAVGQTYWSPGKGGGDRGNKFRVKGVGIG